MTVRTTRTLVPVACGFVSLFVGVAVSAQAPEIHQIDWVGISSATPDSSWGRLTLPYVGSADVMYLNLNINGHWAVQNLSLGSPMGVGVPQTASTFFDINIPSGTDVPSLEYAFSLTPSLQPNAPANLALVAVADLAYQIGGEGLVDLGSPLASAMANITSPMDAVTVLPAVDQFVNQPQGVNECAPGAISNSLKYLQATGRISFSQTIDEVKPWVDWDVDGTPANWYLKKKTYLEARGLSVSFIDAPLTSTSLAELTRQLADGQDIEVDLAGHVAVLVGLRVNRDGTIDFDLADDNQSDNLSDPIRTVRLIDGKLDGMLLERFVIECPEPASATLFVVGGLLLLQRRRT